MKRLLQLLLAALLIGLIAMPEYAHATTYDEYDYTTYDMETGEVTYHRIDDPLAITDNSLNNLQKLSLEGDNNCGVAPASIIGDCDFAEVTNTTYHPYSYTVRIENSVGAATGVVIGRNTILTAAHVVYKSTGYEQSLTIIPAQSGNSKPYGSVTVTTAEITVPSAYIELFEENGKEYSFDAADYDWAIITLDTNIGDYTGWATICSQAASFENQSVKCVGYAYQGTTMFESHGTIMEAETYRFNGDWDQVGGNSGGPIFVNHPTTGWTLYGIAICGIGSDGQNYHPTQVYNSGRKITGTLWYLCNSLGGT